MRNHMKNSTENNLSVVPMAAWLVGLGLLGAIAVWFYQIYIFLLNGFWMSISVVTALSWLKVQWALAPSQWLGLHKILDFLPLSLFSLGIAVVSGWVLEHSGKE